MHLFHEQFIICSWIFHEQRMEHYFHEHCVPFSVHEIIHQMFMNILWAACSWIIYEMFMNTNEMLMNMLWTYYERLMKYINANSWIIHDASKFQFTSMSNWIFPSNFPMNLISINQLFIHLSVYSVLVFYILYPISTL